MFAPNKKPDAENGRHDDMRGQEFDAAEPFPITGKQQVGYMKKIVYGGTVAIVALLAVGQLVRGGNVQPANAAPMVRAQDSGMVDIQALQAKIDVASLPRFDLNHMD